MNWRSFKELGTRFMHELTSIVCQHYSLLRNREKDIFLLRQLTRVKQTSFLEFVLVASQPQLELLIKAQVLEVGNNQVYFLGSRMN